MRMTRTWGRAGASRLAFAAALLSLGAVEVRADAAAGREKAQACAACHGVDGMSQIPNAPHIAGQPEVYLKAQLEAFRSGARVNEMMTVIAKGLSDADIEDLVAWYSSIEVTATEPK